MDNGKLEERKKEIAMKLVDTLIEVQQSNAVVSFEFIKFQISKELLNPLDNTIDKCLNSIHIQTVALRGDMLKRKMEEISYEITSCETRGESTKELTRKQIALSREIQQLRRDSRIRNCENK